MSRWSIATWCLPMVVACHGDALDLGSGGAPNCKSFTACGGDIVGTWIVADECVGGVDNFASICPSSTFGESVSNGGPLTFNANGTYTTTNMGTAPGTFGVESFCLSDAGPTVTCDQLQASFNMQSAQVDGGSSTMAMCTTASSGCLCQLTATQTISGNGTYSTSGTSLTLTPASGSASTVPYCVQGNGLLIQIPGMTGFLNSATLVATK